MDVGAAIGGALPFAVGVALSPIPIVAVVLILTTQRARVNGAVFIAGWLAGLAVVGAIALSIAGPADASSSGAPATWVSWLKVALGAVLLLVAALQFRNRPRNGDRVELPKWITRVNEIKPLQAAGLGVVMGGLNPKNLLLGVAAAAAIAQTGVSGGEQAIAYLVFALVGTLGVGTPVGIYFTMGARSEKPLSELKDWMAQNNAVIMAVICLVIGVKLIGDAIGGLTA
ncbi:MAG TPA: GAP family protein [Trebonia sp.]|nr:GAP family protein [Trebonia sp.]